MNREWGFCTKCDHLIPYEVDGNSTTFPRGEFMVHFDFITTGYKSEEEARTALETEQGRDPSLWTHYSVRYEFNSGSGNRTVFARSEEQARSLAMSELRGDRFIREPRIVSVERK